MTQDGNAGKSFSLGPVLSGCYGSLQGSSRCIPFSRLWDDKADGNEIVRVSQGHEVIPIAFVKASKGCEDQDRFFVGDRVRGVGDIVEMIVNNRRGRSLAIFRCRLEEGSGRRR